MRLSQLDLLPTTNWLTAVRPLVRALSKIQPAVQGKISKVYLLANHQGVKCNKTEAGVSISLPEKAPDAIASVICLETAK